MCITIQQNVNIKTEHCMKSYLQTYSTLYLYLRWYEQLISKQNYYVEQVLKFVRRVSIIASQVVNTVFDKLRYYSWIFVYIVRTARFCISQITFIWNVRTQKIGNPHKSINLYKQDIEISNAGCLCSNVPAAPVCGAYASQLIRYSRTCDSYQDFREGGQLLTMKLLNQGFLLAKLRSSPRMSYGHRHYLVDRYGISVS